MMVVSRPEVTGQALTVNEKGEDVVVPGCLPLVKSLVYRYTALTVWRQLAAGPGGLWSCGRSASARVYRQQGALRDASESDVEASLDCLNRWNNNRNGEDPVAIRKALQECMQHNFSASVKVMRWRKVLSS